MILTYQVSSPLHHLTTLKAVFFLVVKTLQVSGGKVLQLYLRACAAVAVGECLDKQNVRQNYHILLSNLIQSACTNMTEVDLSAGETALPASNPSGKHASSWLAPSGSDLDTEEW